MFQTRRWATAAAAWVSIALPGLCLAATLNVPADYPTIQACIDAAVSGVDECVVAPGTYHETINFLGKAITLRSAGGADVTTIDATGLNNSVVKCISGEGPDTVLDGFTITGGTAPYAPSVGAYVGGGMYNLYSSPTVTNCTFSNNRASSFVPPYRYSLGGGMGNLYSSPTVKNCTFKNNKAPPSPVDHPGVGGGIYNYQSSTTVTHCVFSENIAGGGGGIANSQSSTTVTNCTFRKNEAIWGGGGGMASGGGNSTVVNCAFVGNWAHSGGGMFNADINSTVVNSVFSGNWASSGGGMYNTDNYLTITNCTFSGNTAAYYGGGGMANDHCTLTVTSCTFSGNTANSYYGGGMINGIDSTVTVNDCILWGNSPDQIDTVKSVVTILRFSDVQGGFPGTVNGGGNIYRDPIFVRPPDPGPDGNWDGVDDDYGDLRLQAGSPCINVGDPAFVAQPGETDLDGHARVLCGRVDMGAYEFGIGDYDCDQTVDLMDFANWSACITGPQSGPYGVGCEAFDSNADSDVDLLDFAAFQRVLAAP